MAMDGIMATIMVIILGTPVPIIGITGDGAIMDGMAMETGVGHFVPVMTEALVAAGVIITEHAQAWHLIAIAVAA